MMVLNVCITYKERDKDRGGRHRVSRFRIYGDPNSSESDYLDFNSYPGFVAIYGSEFDHGTILINKDSIIQIGFESHVEES